MLERFIKKGSEATPVTVYQYPKPELVGLRSDPRRGFSGTVEIFNSGKHPESINARYLRRTRARGIRFSLIFPS